MIEGGRLAPVIARGRLICAGLGLLGLGLGGCAQSPQQLAAASHGKEYFPSSVYGAASRRVIADGQPVPRGGGQYLVGRPYTVAGHTYVPSERKLVQVGNASWYGDAFHGRLTANGEIYDKNGFSAAHPTMPLPSYARVTNLRNNFSMIVRVNDRGPYASNRIMDVSSKVADALDFKRTGTAKIKMEYVGRASLAGSDDARLYATLRTNGPAPWQGEPTMVAEAPRPASRVASLSPEPELEERPRQRMVEPEIEAPRHERETSRREETTRRESEGRAAPEQIRQASRQREMDREIGSDRHHSVNVRMPVREQFAERDDRAIHRIRTARLETAHLPIAELLPPPRPERLSKGRVGHDLALPPSRPREMVGEGSRHHSLGLRLARSRDD